MLRDEDEKREMTIARLIDCLGENDPDPEGEDTEVLVRLDKEDNTIDFLSESIFFEYAVGGEKVIAFRLTDFAGAGDAAEKSKIIKTKQLCH